MSLLLLRLRPRRQAPVEPIHPRRRWSKTWNAFSRGNRSTPGPSVPRCGYGVVVGVVRWCRRDTLSLEPRWNVGVVFKDMEPSAQSRLRTVEAVFIDKPQKS